MNLALQVTVLAIIGATTASAHELRGSPLSAAEVNRRNNNDGLTKKERKALKDEGWTKNSRHTKTKQKMSDKSKRAMKRAEKRGKISSQDRKDMKDCVENDNCERRGKKGKKGKKNRNKISKRCRKYGDCPYSELFAGLDDEDIELMEDYFDRYDEEELEFIANFLLGSDDEDDEEDDSEDYYYY